MPEPYWLVEADFAASGERIYPGRYMGGKRLTEDEAPKIVEEAPAVQGGPSPNSRRRRRPRSPRLYDLTSLQRHANTLFGFSARRTLAAAQQLYEEHKALTYPRTNSRFLTGDMIPDIKPIAELVGAQPASTARAPSTSRRSRQAAPGTGGQRRQGRGPPRDHPHQV